MSFQTFVTGRLAAITETLNAIATNAKRIFELPAQNTIDPNSLIHVSRNQVSESLSVQKIIDAVKSNAYSQIITIGEITLVGNVATIPADAEWKINDIFYSNIADIVITIPLADTGLTRTDILVANTLNNIILIQGLETDGIAVRPNIPINTVLVTEINVTDTVIGNPSTPVIGDAFLTKLEKGNLIYSGTGVVDNFELNNTRSCFKFQGSITALKSVSFTGTNGIPYNGKEFIVENNQSIPFDIFHNSGAGDFKFNFPNEENFTLEPNNRIKFRLTQLSDLTGSFDYIGVINTSADVDFELDDSLVYYEDDGQKYLASNISNFTSSFTWLTGDSAIFTLPFTPTNLVSIFVNGLKLYKSSQFTIILPNQIEIIQTLYNEDVVEFNYEHFNNI